MPYGDMTGPAGQGPGTGRRLGKLAGNKMGMSSKKKKKKSRKSTGKYLSEIGQ